MRRTLVFLVICALLAPLSSAAQLHDYTAGQTVVVTFPSKPIRERPTVASQVVQTVVQGDLLEIIDGIPQQNDGLTWWNVEVVATGATGWLADNIFSALEDGCWTAGQRSENSWSWTTPPAMTIDRGSTYIATITTSKGKIILKLDAANAPIATNNFVCLANAGYYDGTAFHRISSNFLIQGGDRSGAGTGTPGYSIPSDPTTSSYPAGSIALANTKSDANGSQFFIAATDLTGKIPNDYPVFGQVVAGQDIVVDISREPVEFNPRGERSQPSNPTIIDSIEITRQEDEIGPPLPTTVSVVDTPAIPTVAPTVALPPTVSMIIELEAKDIAYDPTELTINAADEPVTIKMANTGAALHDFTIDALNIKVEAQPGETVDIVIPAGTAPGIYDFYCAVPGHKQAGMVGKLVIKDSSVAPWSEQSISSIPNAEACDGVAAYQIEYELALYSTFQSNPEATEILSDWVDSNASLADLTYSEFSSLAELFYSAETALERIDPPPIAAEWHRLKVEQIHTIATFLENASIVGTFAASVSYSPEIDRQDTAIELALTRASGCPEFVTWARAT